MRWLVVVTVVLGGCVSSSTETCPSGLVCPAGSTCRVVSGHDTCATQDQLDACLNHNEGESCDPIDPRKTCRDGVCVDLCGNGRVDSGEGCDDGNLVPGDECSATCVVEGCGTGEVDLVLGEECDDGVAGVSGDGCSSTCRLEKPVWTELVQLSVSKVADHAMAPYSTTDTAIDQVVMFGGINIDGILGDTWIWKHGNANPTFEQRFPVRSPSPRHGHGMVYDRTAKRVLLYGGYSTAGVLSDMWEWDGTTWTNVTPASSPGPRMNMGLAYDPLRKVTVMTGGNTANGTISDLWEWNGATKTWTSVNALTTYPPSNSSVQLAYDALRNELIYCGAPENASTWKYNGTWTNLNVACPSGGPLPVGPNRMAYDTHRGKIILVQGNGLVWEWDPVTPQWIARETLIFKTHGTAMFDDGMILVMFGGNGYPYWTTDAFNRGAFSRGVGAATFATQFYTDAAPTSRYAGAATYDTKRQRGVVVGGTPSGTNCGNDTWFFDDQRWHRDGLTPPFAQRCEPALAYDESRDVAVMFGGSQIGPQSAPPFPLLADTWERSGDAQWQPRTWTTAPSARRGAAMVYDSARKQLVLFGGDADASGVTGERLADTWTYDATGWHPMAPGTSPTSRSHAMMAYDPNRDRVVLFGGSNGLVGYGQDTWEWDGATWTRLSHPDTNTNLPPPRAEGTMVYDPLRHRVVLLGGGAQHYNGAHYSDVWEWDGTSWERVHEDPAVARLGAHGFFAPLLGGVVSYGGELSLGGGASAATHVLQWQSSAERETCRIADDEDLDGDGSHGCDDPDCAPRCSGCGNGTCEPYEDRFICSADCP
jgi:cysteine-rich repeat protein